MSDNPLAGLTILIPGKAMNGKSHCLSYLEDQENYLYINADNKRLTFRNKFKTIYLNDPNEIFTYMQAVIDNPGSCKGIIIDTVTKLMEFFHSKNIYQQSGGFQLWEDYAQYFKAIMEFSVRLPVPLIIFGHIDEEDSSQLKGKKVQKVNVQGKLQKAGVESEISFIVQAKCLPLEEVIKYGEHDLLNITEKNQFQGVKFVFQLQRDANTPFELIRSIDGLFDMKQIYMDNNLQILLDKLSSYYSYDEEEQE